MNEYPFLESKPKVHLDLAVVQVCRSWDRPHPLRIQGEGEGEVVEVAVGLHPIHLKEWAVAEAVEAVGHHQPCSLQEVVEGEVGEVG